MAVEKCSSTFSFTRCCASATFRSRRLHLNMHTSKQAADPGIAAHLFLTSVLNRIEKVEKQLEHGSLKPDVDDLKCATKLRGARRCRCRQRTRTENLNSSLCFF